MSISPLNLCSLTSNAICRERCLSILDSARIGAQFKFQVPPISQRIRYRGFQFPYAALADQVYESHDDRNTKNLEFFEKFENFFIYICSILPGGHWWNLSDSKKNGSDGGNSITVKEALLRMWNLLGDDQWVIYVALASLIAAAISEITMPSILAASIFSAQNGEAISFSKNTYFLAVLCLTSGISSGLRSGCFSIANMILVKRFRESLYSALIHQDVKFFDTEEVGGLTSRLGSDCEQISDVIGKNVHLIVRNASQGSGALINLLCLSRPLALSSLFICFILAAIFLVYGRYKRCLKNIASISFRESVAYGFWNMSFHTLYRSTQAIGGSENVFQLMQLSPSDQFLSKGIKLQRLKGEVRFVDVSFHYPSRPTVPILEHIHLSLEANQVIALVGLSGSGKTTLINLLLRLYDPVNGQIYIDGFPLKELDMSWLKENIGYVRQEPELFRTDIKSNITYGCHHEIKQEDIEYAAKLANAHHFISSLPHGYGTLVDDNLLSGGQKQRIAIARAIVRNPTILILDEATSALDPESEDYVKELLHALKNGNKMRRTVIVIAHRLSTIKAADTIIAMDGGRIVEMGSHVDLLHKNGLYSHLIKLEADYLD
ncbi:ABC transporter B family member 26, chloroplastic-like isoform X6 [Euphorbia lathyris]|uniref:ABC transporter B family member 26, chloroplastic-like isoform X6 n=1 Tax=Euphorbia lathyris TaxID=212925 RepID=UPI003313A5C9